MYYVSAAAGIAPIHVNNFWDLSTMCFVSLFCFVCQLHILVALQWNKTRLHAVFLFRFHYFRSIIFLYAKLSFFPTFFFSSVNILKFVVLFLWSNQFFAPQFAIIHNDRLWIWCVMRFSQVRCTLSTPTTTSKTDSFSFFVSTVQHNVVKISQFIPLNVKLFSIDELLHAVPSFDIMNGISYSMYFSLKNGLLLQNHIIFR